MKSPFFSIIIPLFNKESHIARAIDSVICQNFTDFELIIVNDGSTDNSVNIVESFDSSLIILINQINSGVSAARNKGIANASGKYIAFLDADDEWTDEHLQDFYEMITKYPDAGMFATAYKIVDIDGTEKKLWDIGQKCNKINVYPIDYFKESYRDIRLPITSSSVCIKKNVFSKYGNFAVGKSHGEDLDMWGRVALYEIVVFCDNTTSVYYKDSQNRSIEEKNVDEFPFVDTYKKLFDNNAIEVKSVYVKEYLAMQQFIRAKKYLFSSQLRRSRAILYNTKTSLQKKKWLILFILTFIPSSLSIKLLSIKNKIS